MAIVLVIGRTAELAISPIAVAVSIANTHFYVCIEGWPG